MRKKITAMMLVGLMLTQSPFVSLAETLQAEEELAVDVIAVGETAEDPASVQEAAGGAGLVEELPADELPDATVTEEGTVAEAAVIEEVPVETSVDSEESALPEEDLGELTEDISAVGAADGLVLQEEVPEEIIESTAAESLFPEEEAAEDETEIVEEEADLTEAANPTWQAADEFYAAAGAILSTFSFDGSTPDAAGTSQLTKDTVAKTLKDKIIAGAKKDSEGNYYLLTESTVNGVAIKNTITYLTVYNEFFFETEFNTVIEGVTYVANINISVPFGNTSSVEVRYFLDNASTKQNYLIANAVITKPASYKGTEDIEFTVQGLDDDLLDYEVQELTNSTLKSSFASWNTMLLSKAKVSMRTLGFDNFVMSHKHTYKGIVIAHSSRVQDGRYREICSTCGDIKTNLTVPQIDSFALSYYKVGYTGTVQKPVFVVKDRTGAVVNSKYYDVTYSNANSRAIGTYSATVKLKDRYYGSRTLKYSIVKQSQAPAMPKLSAADNNATGINVYWFEVSKATQYIIYRKENDRWKAIKTLGSKDSQLMHTATRLYYKDTTVKDNYGSDYVYSVAAKVGTGVSAFDTHGIDIVRLKQPTISKVTKLSDTQAKVVWKAEDCEGYQVQYKVDGGNWMTCADTTKTARYVSNLKKGKKYIFRLRTFSTSNKMGKYYSQYSKNFTFTMP